VQSLTELKTDVTKRYIDWAVDNDFQVIDVNIPRVVSVENVSLLVFWIKSSPANLSQPDYGYVRSDDSAARALRTRELAAYLWENYIE
jgi:histone deacetylase 6